MSSGKAQASADDLVKAFAQPLGISFLAFKTRDRVTRFQFKVDEIERPSIVARLKDVAVINTGRTEYSPAGEDEAFQQGVVFRLNALNRGVKWRVVAGDAPAYVSESALKNPAAFINALEDVAGIVIPYPPLWDTPAFPSL